MLCFGRKRKKFRDALKEVENSIKAGFEGNRWFSHSSLEGGTDTLAFGHKLTRTEIEANRVSLPSGFAYYKEGLSPKQAEELLTQDIRIHEDIAETHWGEGFEELPYTYRMVLVNIVFNVGGLRSSRSGRFLWPKLKKAMQAGDDKAVRQQMVTTYKSISGETVRLEKRAETIADALGLGR